ncbi:caspase-14 [Eurytemora carolleeae]|uniref:caspase-14 n=1 Tax=Eurytemora carolleeae TaxID=1294199 RepID=UPI000C771953|nr:caspase-14 [Eurytemora carolleeae]|eukprot:XP_023324909.1 caspase-14-like [Eurytemora affinis]
MSQDLSSDIPRLSIGENEENETEMSRNKSPSSNPSGFLDPMDSHEIRPVSPDSGSMRSMNSCRTDQEPTERGKMDVVVVPATIHRSNSQMDSNMAAYDMYRLPRGLAVIIDIEIYENDVQERRVGSHVDVKNLFQLFEGLSFEVELYQNLQLSQFHEVITEFRSNKQHLESDMAIVAILSHGKDGIVYAADGQSIDMEGIYELFNNKNCPLLQGKPKFFIVQACRGDYPDQGVERENERPAVAKKRRAAGLDRIPNTPDVRGIGRARPTWEDMIIAYSTIPGYASLRDHERGTWFIQSLVEVFMSHAHNTELVDLLRMTSERLSHFSNEQGEKQTCNVEMRHLYKRIYFNPGNLSN